MKIITSPKIYEKTFLRLMEEHEEYYWAVAWAGIGSKAYKKLLCYEHKIRKIVVGIHFHQTSPEFIEQFNLEDKNVKYIKQPNGTFHPKLYLFRSKNKWSLLLGSSNFTNSAFCYNTEASILIEGKKDEYSNEFEKAMGFIDSHWLKATLFRADEFRLYKTLFNKTSKSIKSISGRYDISNKQNKQLFDSDIAKMSWDEFVFKVKNSIDSFDERVKVTTKVRELFLKCAHFNELELEERKYIAGIPNSLIDKEDETWRHFGSMMASGKFKNRIIENDPNISRALDHIPLHGDVTEKNYRNFYNEFEKTFQGNFKKATSTRLLSMKRPDVFICLNSKNEKLLCEDFGIKKSNMNSTRYWNEIILRLRDCHWWIESNPTNKNEINIFNARTLFLDSIYYEGL